MQDGAQNVEPFQFCLAFVFCRKMLHVTTPVVAWKYGELLLVHRMFIVTTILSHDLFNTNVHVYSHLATQMFKNSVVQSDDYDPKFPLICWTFSRTFFSYRKPCEEKVAGFKNQYYEVPKCVHPRGM